MKAAVLVVTEFKMKKFLIKCSAFKIASMQFKSALSYKFCNFQIRSFEFRCLSN